MASVSGSGHGAPVRGDPRDRREDCFWERMTWWGGAARAALERAVAKALGGNPVNPDEGDGGRDESDA